MKRDRSEIGRALANIDQQISELQLARQIIVDARGPQRDERLIPRPGLSRARRTKAQMAAAAEPDGIKA